MNFKLGYFMETVSNVSFLFASISLYCLHIPGKWAFLSSVSAKDAALGALSSAFLSASSGLVTTIEVSGVTKWYCNKCLYCNINLDMDTKQQHYFPFGEKHQTTVQVFYNFNLNNKTGCEHSHTLKWFSHSSSESCDHLEQINYVIIE